MRLALATILVVGCGAPSSWNGLTGDDPTLNDPKFIPQQISPMSTSILTTRTPILKWALQDKTDGAVVELCRARDCEKAERTYRVTGDTGSVETLAIDTPLDPPGWWFWRLRVTSGHRVATKPGPTWQMLVPAQDAGARASYGTVMDLNGDGLTDLVTSAPRADGGRGVVYVYYATDRDGLPSTPSVTLRAPEGATLFGQSLASAGDVDSDGFPELIVGAAGHAYVYLGDGDPWPNDRSPVFTMDDQKLGNSFGKTVTSAGDLDGDGYADVVIGAPDVSALVVALGLDDGRLAPLPAIRGPRQDVLLGAALAGGCDFNADGYGDALVGAPAHPTTANPDNINAVLTLLGGNGAKASGPTPSEPLNPVQNPTDVGFGSAIACADVTGDGYGDILAGVPGLNGALVWPATNKGQFVQGQGVPINNGAAGFGTSIALAGDVNADGVMDIVVGATASATIYLGGTTAGATLPKGGSVAPLFDVGPGGTFVAVGTPDAIYVYSTDGRLQFTLTAPEQGADFGREIN